MKIGGAVFDFGGVMTSCTMPERVRPLVDELGIPWKALETGFAKYRKLMDADFMTMDEMYDKIWMDAGLKLDAVARARIIEQDVASFLHRDERTLAWMKELKAQGLKIGILTNMCTDFARRFRATFPDFIAVADAMVISGEEHLYKPQREIYDLLASRIGLPASELCFFDDVEANCRGARDAGWQAICFQSIDQARLNFNDLTRCQPTAEKVVEAAIRMRAHAYAPYSHFTVGAAVLAESGKVYTGANVENASYGATVCAERVAVFKAVAAGERRLVAIALAGGREGGPCTWCAPCGICRQVLREFADPKSFRVILARSSSETKVFALDALLPESFGPENLKLQA